VIVLDVVLAWMVLSVPVALALGVAMRPDTARSRVPVRGPLPSVPPRLVVVPMRSLGQFVAVVDPRARS
jgi:hypothetical protein